MTTDTRCGSVCGVSVSPNRYAPTTVTDCGSHRGGSPSLNRTSTHLHSHGHTEQQHRDKLASQALLDNQSVSSD